MFSILDGEGTDDSGAFTSSLLATSKTTEPTINGESIYGTVDVQLVLCRPPAAALRKKKALKLAGLQFESDDGRRRRVSMQ